MLTFGDNMHVTPQGVYPEVAPYCILTDAVSKSFAGTGYGSVGRLPHHFWPTRLSR